MVVDAINQDRDGPYKEVNYNFDQLNEMRIAALMHDVGKITTPEYVVDKATKLETIYDRINVVRTRTEVLKRDARIAMLEAQLALQERGEATPEAVRELEAQYKAQVWKLEEDLVFLEQSNIGGEFMADEKIQRVKEIAGQQWMLDDEPLPFLNGDEVENLCIRKGTLTGPERQKINDHALMSYKMLNALPFPKKLRRVPEIAGGHHEKLNGKGYPMGLTDKELSLEARILALADIFEALTASDRPYKDAKKMSEVKKIIGFMVKDYELDAQLIDFFFDRKLHVRYAQKELKPEQLDVEE